MIKLLDNFESYDISNFNDVFFEMICSDYLIFSVFDSALFYICEYDGEVCAVFSKIGGNVTLSANEKAHFDEISEFLDVIGYCKLLCESKYSIHFKGKKSSGSILKCESKESYSCKAKELYSEELKKVYELICRYFSLNMAFDEWFVDVSHKMRHSGARAYGVYCEDKLVSVSFSLFETEKSAVLSSVCTDENFRKSGFGEDVVKKVLRENIGKNVYLFADNRKIEGWYEKIGFGKYKLWSEIENVL